YRTGKSGFQPYTSSEPRSSIRPSRQVRQRVSTLNKFPQAGFNSWFRKQIAENVNLSLQFFTRNWLDEFLGCSRRLAIKLRNLRRRGSRSSQGLTFPNDLADQANLLRLRCIEASPCKQQIADHCVPQVAFQSRNAAKPGNQSQAQFGKTKAGHSIRNNKIAHQSQLEASPERYSMDRSNRCDWGFVNCVEHAMNPFEKLAHTACSSIFFHLLRTLEKLPQIRACGKSRLQRAMQDERVIVLGQFFERRGKLF